MSAPSEEAHDLDAAGIVRRVYQAFNSLDSEVIERTVRKFFTDDIVIREPESLPWGGAHEGIDTVAAMVRGLADPAAPIDAARVVVERLFVDEVGDGTAHVVAAVSFPLRGTSTIPMRALEWFTVREGRVCELAVYLWDTVAAVSALGLSTDHTT